MGAALWVAAGLAAFFIARIVPYGRTRRFWGELVISIVTAATFGALATALDFGGWREPDWRAVLFCFLGTAAVLGAIRAVAR